MLIKIVSLINSSKSRTEDGTLFCSKIIVNDEIEHCLKYLDEHTIIENLSKKKDSTTIDLELSIVRLKSIGYYLDLSDLVNKNKYSLPSAICFVKADNKFSNDPEFLSYQWYESVIDFIDALKGSATHTYTDVDTDYSLILRDDKSLLLPFMYNANDINALTEEHVVCIKTITSIILEENSEKKLLFINELVDYLSPGLSNTKFTTLIRNIDDLLSKCNNAYQYYLRDFSYNKLKIELDAKTLEFTQKIQNVINDSQNKLITIPTAFVLVFVAFDFENIDSIKNIASIISLFVFSVLIQIFLNNQGSSLKFTAANIETYQGTFELNNGKEFAERFELVNDELRKQQNRLCLITWILWSLPIILLITFILLKYRH